MTLTTERSRPIVRHELAVRHLSVSAVRDVSNAIRRVTLVGDELAGFVSDGPDDHVKAFFPDPETGVYNTPTLRAGGSLERRGPLISRDYTPLAYRTSAGRHELDIDFVLHGDNGPASRWAARAQPGSALVVAGPRGSRLAPTGFARALYAADATALPALVRFVEATPLGTQLALVVLASEETARDYLPSALGERATVSVVAPNDPDALLAAVSSSPLLLDADTFVWAGGEATTLVPLRRRLRRELGLPASSVSVNGYWRAGVTDFDHHAPLDETDPDD